MPFLRCSYQEPVSGPPPTHTRILSVLRSWQPTQSRLIKNVHFEKNVKSHPHTVEERISVSSPPDKRMNLLSERDCLFYQQLLQTLESPPPPSAEGLRFINLMVTSTDPYLLPVERSQAKTYSKSLLCVLSAARCHEVSKCSMWYTLNESDVVWTQVLECANSMASLNARIFT